MWCASVNNKRSFISRTNNIIQRPASWSQNLISNSAADEQDFMAKDPFHLYWFTGISWNNLSSIPLGNPQPPLGCSYCPFDSSTSSFFNEQIWHYNAWIHLHLPYSIINMDIPHVWSVSFHWLKYHPSSSLWFLTLKGHLCGGSIWIRLNVSKDLPFASPTWVTHFEMLLFTYTGHAFFMGHHWERSWGYGGR